MGVQLKSLMKFLFVRFRVAKYLSTRLLAGVGTMTRMGAVLNFSSRVIYFQALHLDVPWGKPNRQLAHSIYCLQIIVKLSMPPRSAMFIDDDHNLPPSSCPSNHFLKIWKSADSQKAELKNLVIEYSDIFQPSTAGLQQTVYVHYNLDTGNAQSSNLPPYRVSPTERQIISDQIDSMLHDDIISPFQSPWASPIILVKKRWNKTILC